MMRAKQSNASYIGYQVLPKGFEKHADRTLLDMPPLPQEAAIAGPSSDSTVLALGLPESSSADPEAFVRGCFSEMLGDYAGSSA